MISKFTVTALLCFVLLAITCKHKPPIYPATEPISSIPPIIPPTKQVNVVDSICYSEQIQPIFNSNCSFDGCHTPISKAAGIDLSTFPTVTTTVSGDLLMQAIQDKGPLGMPQDPHKRLDSVQIQTIAKWVIEGMKNGVDCLGPCKLDSLSYKTDIYPIFDNNCIGCHKDTVPVFSTYPQIKTLVDNGKILCTITHATGCSHMPKNATDEPLSACKIEQIRRWIGDGAPNN